MIGFEQATPPLENAVSAKRQTLQDLKPLLEDRGGKKIDLMPLRQRSKFNDSSNTIRNIEIRRCEKDRHMGDVCVSEKGNKLRFSIGKSRVSVFRYKVIVLGIILAAAFLDSASLGVAARSSEPRYETAYACEGKTLKIGCAEGSVIHLIRANYGRFSITICNDHGNTDWSVNCMSTRSLRVLHSRCSMHQNCSILASTNMFGDPCTNTLKYLEAHYQCVPASTTSTTNRPSPPWLITSQPTVWRSTPSAPKPPGQVHSGKKPTVITPPTFRPHITLPPELKPGDIGTKKTTSKDPETSSEKEFPKIPKETQIESKPKLEEDEDNKEDVDRSRPRNDKPNRDDEVTEEAPHWPNIEVKQEAPLPPNLPPAEEDVPGEDGDGFKRRYEQGSSHATPAAPGGIGGRSYCAPVYARGLHWNWTMAGTYSVQPCPGGATGLARWRCTATPNHHMDEERSTSSARRRGSGLQSAENFRDLGLDQAMTTSAERQNPLIKRISGESLLKGSDGEAPESMTDYRGTPDMLPGAMASTTNLVDSANDYSYDATPAWHGATPDLSECRSVWLNSLEARVRDGESLLSISNDLAQVTSSKTLYGGDMTTTTSIMKKLAQRMAQNVQTFPDPRQREAIVTDMLLGVIKTGSNLLEEAQRASWQDLGLEAQQRAATALLTQLEENAFLLADAVAREKTILQIVKNICLSVRVLEVRNVGDETFPSPIAQEGWKSSEDTITIPRAALLENRENDLVRIVFVAFDRLEEILQPVYRPGRGQIFASSDAQMSMNTEREKMNVTKVLNSKVISASLGKGRHIQLPQMVKITMKHLRTENVTNPTCVFWDYTVNVWSSEGCEREWWNATHTGCACKHLTNFAILMDIHGTWLSPGHELALLWITRIGCSISSVALLAAVIVFHCFRNMKSDRVTIHKNLCACLLVAEVIFMAGIDQYDNEALCAVIAGLLHYFFLAAFAWMFLEGFHLYAMLVEVFEPERPRARWYCVAAYTAPAIVVLASAAAYPQGYGTRRHCWLSTDRMFVMSFVGPVALVLMANWICLSMVIYMMCHHSNVSIKAKENSKLYKIRVWLNSSLVLAFLLGLTWTFGLLYLNEQTVGVAYAFTILNSLQGLFIFVFHCLQNEIFQKECARLGRRHSWLSCCLYLAGQSAPAQAPTASSSNNVERQGSVKSRRYHQSASADVSDDVMDPRDGVTNTSSKHHVGGTSTLPHHHDTLSRQLAQQNHLHSPYSDCDQQIAPGSPRHIKDEESPLHHPQGYQTTRSYNHDFRNPHVYMAQHSPGSQEMIFRKHRDERRKHYHHHGSQNINHTYSEIAGQQGRIYRRGSEQEFRVIQDDPVYEEIERNETLMSDMSDDNSGPDLRQGDLNSMVHHGSTGSKFYGDHRPLISYSPGDRHHHDQVMEQYAKYGTGKWDNVDPRNYDPRAYESGRLMGHPYHQPQESNMRALAAVLNGENNVVCHLEPHANSYDVYQPQTGNSRTVSQPSF